MSESESDKTTLDRQYAFHLGMFLATCFTTTFVGAMDIRPDLFDGSISHFFFALKSGLPFSLSLLGILITHEMGHYVFARKHNVDVSLPLFIPLPIGIGTLGAVIRMKGTLNSRNALADIGAAGPLAGLIVAIPILIYGIHLSLVAPLSPGLLEGNSILYILLKFLVKGAILPGNGLDVHLHPVAWAGWVGLLVTMINLLPIGQLDGGHIAYAYWGKQHNTSSLWFHRALLFLAIAASIYTIIELSEKTSTKEAILFGWSAGMPWFVWWVLLKLMLRMTHGQYHPPVTKEDLLSKGRKRICILMFIVFLCILTPIPLRRTL